MTPQGETYIIAPTVVYAGEVTIYFTISGCERSPWNITVIVKLTVLRTRFRKRFFSLYGEPDFFILSFFPIKYSLGILRRVFSSIGKEVDKRDRYVICVLPFGSGTIINVYRIIWGTTVSCVASIFFHAETLWKYSSVDIYYITPVITLWWPIVSRLYLFISLYISLYLYTSHYQIILRENCVSSSIYKFCSWVMRYL